MQAGLAVDDRPAITSCRRLPDALRPGSILRWRPESLGGVRLRTQVATFQFGRDEVAVPIVHREAEPADARRNVASLGLLDDHQGVALGIAHPEMSFLRIRQPLLHPEYLEIPISGLLHVRRKVGVLIQPDRLEARLGFGRERPGGGHGARRKPLKN